MTHALLILTKYNKKCSGVLYNQVQHLNFYSVKETRQTHEKNLKKGMILLKYFMKEAGKNVGK